MESFFFELCSKNRPINVSDCPSKVHSILYKVYEEGSYTDHVLDLPSESLMHINQGGCLCIQWDPPVIYNQEVHCDWLVEPFVQQRAFQMHTV